MRLSPRDHTEAFALARRLECSDAGSVRDDRRALLLFWYGSGAARLRLEEDVLLSAWERYGGRDHPLNAAIRSELARLAAAVEEVAGDAAPSPMVLRRVGAALTALLRDQDGALCAVVERVLPRRELADVELALSRAHG